VGRLAHSNVAVVNVVIIY